MKLTRKAATRALTLVAAGGVVLGMSATALATPAYEPDPTDQIGQILFYDASGNLVTGGNINDAPMAAFAVATNDDPQTANTTATLFGYTPQVGVNPQLWSGEQLSNTTTFPVASPANIAAVGAHRPVVTGSAIDSPLSQLIGDFPNTNASGSGYENRYQLRIKTPNNDPKYWAADVLVNPSNGTWTLDYPTLAGTTTTLSATPASPQTAPASAVTLTATVTANAPGAVVFKDTDTNTQVGSTQTLPGTASNTASVTIPAGLAVGIHHYSATYSPAVGATFNSSAGTLTYQVNTQPADVTQTTLSVNPLTGTVGDTITLSSHVSDTTAPGTVPVGTVSWTDGATTIAGPVTLNASGDATASGDFGLAAGTHSITAHYSPTNAAFSASDSQPVTVTLSPATGSPCSNTGSPKPYPNDSRSNICEDPQNLQVTVPRGNLFISTPYHVGNPFDLGTLQLAPDGTTLHASAPFGSSSAPQQGVTIIDTRAAGEGWTATVKSTDFTSGSNAINACNLGFTGVTPGYISGNAINAGTKPITVANVPNGGTPGVAPGASCSTGLAGSGHTFASIAANGTGSVYVYGDMDLYAPTSTPAGLYTATVTFTIF